MDKFKRQCKLCESIVKDENFKVIEDGIKSIFNFLLLKLTLDHDFQNVMCTMCCSKLFSALNFKSECLDRDNTITPYVDFENPTPVDLKEVYAKEKAGKQRDRICRLCPHPISCDVKPIQEVPVETIRIFIPEINFVVTRSPVICIKCYDALCVHSSFIKTCLEVEKKRKIVPMDVGDTFLTDPFIKTEETEIKSELTDDVTLSEIFSNLDKQESEPGDTSLHSENMFIEENETPEDPDDLNTTIAESTSVSVNKKSKECIYRIRSESPLTGLRRQYDKDSEILGNKSDGGTGKTNCQYSCKRRLKSTTEGLKLQKYQRNNCVFYTNHGTSFTQHELLHKYPSELQIYRCDKCDYKSRRKGDLRRHQLIHKNPSEMQIYECGKCKFMTKHKSSLTNHELTHKDPSEIQMYQCDQCSHKTKRKRDLKKHQLTHKAPSEIQMYECNQCKFVSKRKSGLVQHELRHKSPSDAKMYECSECDYKSLQRGHLKTHQLTHRDASEIPMYGCSQCSYKSKGKRSLQIHQVTCKGHLELPVYKRGYKAKRKGDLKPRKDPSEVGLYACAQCKFTANFKSNLVKHQLKHKDPSEIELYGCSQCSYKTKRKRNLKDHQLTHRDPSEIQMFECSRCSYKSKRKGNLKNHQLTHKDA